MAYTFRIIDVTHRLETGTVVIRYNAGEGTQAGPWSGDSLEIQLEALPDFIAASEAWLSDPTNILGIMLAPDPALSNPAQFAGDILNIDIRDSRRGVTTTRSQRAQQ